MLERCCFLQTRYARRGRRPHCHKNAKACEGEGRGSEQHGSVYLYAIDATTLRLVHFETEGFRKLRDGAPLRAGRGQGRRAGGVRRPARGDQAAGHAPQDVGE